ncbi:hypothetical protein [Streptomyces sp. NPDC002104]
MSVGEPDEVAADREPVEPAGWAWIEPGDTEKAHGHGRLKWGAVAAAGVGALIVGSQVFPGHLMAYGESEKPEPDPTRVMVLADYAAVASAVRLPADLAEDGRVVEVPGDCVAAWSSYEAVTRGTVVEVAGVLVDRGWNITGTGDDPVPVVSLSRGRWRLTVFNEMPSGPAHFGLVASHRTPSCDAKASELTPF